MRQQQQQQQQQFAGCNNNNDKLLIIRHLPVFSVGRRLNAKNHLLKEAIGTGADIVDSSRGGDVTYHGPGQVVVYPIVDLSVSPPHKKDLRWYLKTLEETMIDCVSKFNVIARAGSDEGMSGCWVGDGKIGAIGINASSWITSHGIAINVDNRVLPYFNAIVPCGLKDTRVTTLEEEMKKQKSNNMKSLTCEDVEMAFIQSFSKHFNLHCVNADDYSSANNSLTSPSSSIIK